MYRVGCSQYLDIPERPRGRLERFRPTIADFTNGDNRLICQILPLRVGEPFFRRTRNTECKSLFICRIFELRCLPIRDGGGNMRVTILYRLWKDRLVVAVFQDDQEGQNHYSMLYPLI